METIAPADLRSELLDNCDLDLHGPVTHLRAIATEAQLPAACLISITAAIASLQAAGEHLEAAAAIADGISTG